MGKASDQGPKKLNKDDKAEYKDFSNQQAVLAKEKAQQISLKKSMVQTEETKEETVDWRKGNFSEPKPVPQEQQQCFGASLMDTGSGSNEQKPMSKHAKRRANKKAKQAEQSHQQEDY